MAKKKADKEVTITETIKISETTALMKLSDGTFKVGFILTQEEVEKLLSEVGEEEKPKGKGKDKAPAKGKGKAKDEDDDRILGLETGADDYITKPFNTREVVARVKAVLRRSGQATPKTAERLNFPELMIDLSEYKVVAFGKNVTFTAKEMELLWCLASNPGLVFSRNQLLETIWGYTYYGDTRTVDTHIKRVRHKLDIPKDSPWDITTVWGVGYKFEVKN